MYVCVYVCMVSGNPNLMIKSLYSLSAAVLADLSRVAYA